MKTLYLDCGMGAAGDMLAAALLELLDDPESFIGQMNDLEIPGVEIKKRKAFKCGISGTQMSVIVQGIEEKSEDVKTDHHQHSHIENHSHEGEHSHHSYTGILEIQNLISNLRLPEEVKKDIREVYDLLAEAESSVHGKPVEQIHFHEVGTMDALVDITAVCWLMHLISPERMVVSPVHVGSGHVRCAHGILPVPAPAASLST